MSKSAQITAGVIVLAAGCSQRMGTPKQLLEYRGCSLLRHTVIVALKSCCRPVLVVLPPENESFRDELRGLCVTIVENSHYKEGMSTSICAGLKAFDLYKEKNQAVIFMLCDQPLVTSCLIDELCEIYLRTGKSIIASMYADTPGVPALFSREYFLELSKLTGDRGAKRIIDKHRDDIVCVEFPGGTVDIDTREDYLRLSGD